MAFTLVLEQATLTFNSRSATPFMVYPSAGEAFAPALEAGDGYSREIEYFTHLIQSGEPNTVIPPSDARESVRLAREVMP